MAPTSQIILCRHSQAEHNVDLDYSIPDAPLTPLGKKQSASLAPQISDLQDSVELIVTSALKRTLQSTKLGWAPAVQRLGIKNVICLPQAQECNDFPCDTGSSREILESDPEFSDFNLELLTPDWTSKKGFFAPDPASIANRARWVRQYLRNRPEQRIVLVAHGDILRQITATAEKGPSTYMWKNAEVRIFEFDPRSVDTDDCFLYQKEDVAAAGGYDATSTEMDIQKAHVKMSVGDSDAAPLPEAGPSGNNRIDEDDIEQDELEDGTGQGRESTGELLDITAVGRDPSIVAANGMIFFPRSDGDPAYCAPNTEVPPKSATEVNYFHVFSNDEPKATSWRKTIGRKIAVDHFKLGDHIDWQIATFPKDYQFTEQRKTVKGSLRTDPYLFGSEAHRFRSTNEFIPHALWLLTDPSLDPSRCLCKYCHKGSEWQTVAGSSRVKAERGPPGERLRPTAKLPKNGLQPYIGYGIHIQQAPKLVKLPGVPVGSCRDRDRELAFSETKEGGHSEGYRRGEFANFILKEPVSIDLGEGESCTISRWPVKILNSFTKVNVDRTGPGAQPKTFDLEGRVSQERCYDVSLMGTDEVTQADETQLLPGLLVNQPELGGKVGLGTRKEHTWIGQGVPELNLTNGKKRAPFRHIFVVLLIQIRTLSLIRSTYTMTEPFHRRPHHGPAPPVANAIGPGEQAAEESAAAANRFVPQKEDNVYMSLDDDDSSARRRRSTASESREESLASTADLVDANTYWQGMYFGLDRIWVSDVVRLRLGPDDISTMMKALAEGDNVQNAKDRHELDIASSYVMYVKAIYRAPNAEVTPREDKIRVAGDVYRVVRSDADSTKERDDAKLGEEEDHNREESVGFYEPERPFVDPQRKDRGEPKLPWMPKGFELQRVNRKNVEVVCAVPQLSGRVYPSLVSNVELHAQSAPYIKDTASLVREVLSQQRRDVVAHEDCDDRERTRLSAAGLITGAAKAMEVDTTRGNYPSRDQAFVKAREKAYDVVLRYFKEKPPATVGNAARSSSPAVPMPSSAEAKQTSSSASAKGKRGHAHDEQNLDSPTGTEEKRTRSSAPSEERGGATIDSRVSHGNSVSTPSVSIRSPVSASAGTNEPPLPPDWVKKESKQIPGTFYYANKKTRLTQWERPTE